MKSILVGIDGSERGERALEWAARHANRESARLTLLTVVDTQFMRDSGANEDSVYEAVQQVLDEAAKTVAEKYPFVTCETRAINGKVVDTLVDIADEHDMIVLGTHHGRSIGKTIGGAKGLRVAISTKVPTVVVPADWSADQEGSGIAIAVGPGPDDGSDDAVMFGVEHALAMKTSLKLVSAWGLPAFLSRPAKAMGGELYSVGETFQAALDRRVESLKRNYPELDVMGQAMEGPSPTKVLLEYSQDCAMLVMGTHSRSALGRTVFGSVTHSVLLNLTAPTVVVPQRNINQ